MIVVLGHLNSILLGNRFWETGGDALTAADTGTSRCSWNCIDPKHPEVVQNKCKGSSGISEAIKWKYENEIIKRGKMSSKSICQ